MNKIFLIILITFTFILGTIFFLIQKELLIFRLPTLQQEKNISNKIIKKSEIKIWFWKNSKWNYEKIEINLNENQINILNLIITNWLNLIEEENLINNKVLLQKILITSDNKQAYISFDKKLFNNQNSIFQKLMIIESLLKTIKENDSKLQNIYFLVDHQVMSDQHLDFSNIWPITGFLKN